MAVVLLNSYLAPAAKFLVRSVIEADNPAVFAVINVAPEARVKPVLAAITVELPPLITLVAPILIVPPLLTVKNAYGLEAVPIATPVSI